MFSLAGKVALVTGASRGLGWAIAQAFARSGPRYFLNGRDPASLTVRRDQLIANGTHAEITAFDVNDHQACLDCVTVATERYGKLDILAANAGINHRAPIIPSSSSTSQTSAAYSKPISRLYGHLPDEQNAGPSQHELRAARRMLHAIERLPLSQ